MLLPKLHIGGAEMQVLNLIKHLDTARFSVSLCCFKRGDHNMEREVERYVESIFYVRFRWRNCLVSFMRLVRYLRRWRFDVLHCHLPLADSIGRLAGATAGVPVLVTTEHGKNLWKGSLYLILERILNRFTDMRICVSRDILEIRRRREGTPPGKLVHVPNAIDPDGFTRPAKGRAAVMAEFGWPPDSDLVVSVGRLAVEKNYTLLVDAIVRLRDRFPKIRCLLVGDGDRADEIRRRIESAGAEERIVLAGSRSDIPDILAAADLFVLSSIREGLPVALLEAMASGTAIAATAVGGIPEVIRDGVSGLLVPPVDAAALAEAVGTLLGNADLRRALGKEGRKIVEKEYSIRRTAELIGAIYQDLYDAKRALRRDRA
jgi:glycosyltransferase involved in cell wall biosynthesis